MMINITEYVPANEIWPTAKTFIDKGYRSGLVRGYNIEVTRNGETFWLSSEYIHGDPDVELFDEFHQFYYNDINCKPTGRICFRGYGVERYDYEERDTYIEPVEV